MISEKGVLVNKKYCLRRPTFLKESRQRTSIIKSFEVCPISPLLIKFHAMGGTTKNSTRLQILSTAKEKKFTCFKNSSSGKEKKFTCFKISSAGKGKKFTCFKNSSAGKEK
jgi:hypothetical protein